MPMRSIVGGWVANSHVRIGAGSGSLTLRTAIRRSKPMNGSGASVSRSA